MNLSASEKIFLAAMILLAVLGTLSLSYFQYSQGPTEIEFSAPEESDTEYPVAIINGAAKEDFMKVKGIGESRAEEIIAFREAIGGFRRAEQLKEISGIGEGVYNNILEYFYSSSEEDPESAEQEYFTEAPKVPSTEETSASVTAEAPEQTDIRTEESEESEKPDKSGKSQSEAIEEPEEQPQVMSKININAATAEEISKALSLTDEQAEKIVALRERIGSFSTKEELFLLDFMTPELYRRIKDYVEPG